MSDRREALIEELREAGQIHRLHITLLFGQLTVFLAATGGVVSALLSEANSTTARVMGAFGLLLAFVFLVQHERVHQYSRFARDRAISAQNELGVTVYAVLPSSRWLRIGAGYASRLLYLSAAAFWVYVIIRGVTDLK